ncbi:MAG: MFS transporter, partial [Antricoccus sp.]
MTEQRRWVILGIGVFAQASTCSFVYGMPMLIPALRSAEQLTLFQSGLVISAPILGLLLTLIAWGVAADRRGERSVIALGVTIAAIALAATYFVHGVVPIGLLLV